MAVIVGKNEAENYINSMAHQRDSFTEFPTNTNMRGDARFIGKRGENDVERHAAGGEIGKEKHAMGDGVGNMRGDIQDDVMRGPSTMKRGGMMHKKDCRE